MHAMKTPQWVSFLFKEDILRIIPNLELFNKNIN